MPEDSDIEGQTASEAQKYRLSPGSGDAVLNGYFTMVSSTEDSSLIECQLLELLGIHSSPCFSPLVGIDRLLDGQLRVDIYELLLR